MCGRFFLDAKNREIDRLLEELPLEGAPVKTGEVFPTETALVLAKEKGQIKPEAMSWGFPRHDAKGVVFNARSESALHKPFFARALINHPAIIPVSGFYEWKEEPGQKKKIKYLFYDRSGDLLYLAGFWKTFSDSGGLKVPCFTILTKDANQFMRPYHSRMPVLLDRKDLSSWLDGTDRRGTLERETAVNLACDGAEPRYANRLM